MRRLQRTVALALVGAAMTLGGCQSQYDGVEIELLRGVHYQSEASSERIRLPEGSVVVFSAEVKAKAVGDDYDALDIVRFQAEDTSVARVVQGLRVDTWIILGTAEGQTELSLWVNHALEDTIPVDIEPQEDQP